MPAFEKDESLPMEDRVLDLDGDKIPCAQPHDFVAQDLNVVHGFILDRETGYECFVLCVVLSFADWSSQFWPMLTNIAYLPSTTFPAGFGAQTRLPIGLNVVGARMHNYCS